MLAALFIVGGLDYWYQFYKPKKIADKTLIQAARDLGISPAHLQKSFKRVVGVSPRQYAEARRLERLKGRLRAG